MRDSGPHRASERRNARAALRPEVLVFHRPGRYGQFTPVLDTVADTGNLGSHDFCRDGVWELKIDVGPGYRVYYAEVKKTIVLLLCGGAKRTQDRDITQAVKSWQDYQKRS